jgi:hypothetical protein
MIAVCTASGQIGRKIFQLRIVSVILSEGKPIVGGSRANNIIYFNLPAAVYATTLWSSLLKCPIM